MMIHNLNGGSEVRGRRGKRGRIHHWEWRNIVCECRIIIVIERNEWNEYGKRVENEGKRKNQGE